MPRQGAARGSKRLVNAEAMSRLGRHRESRGSSGARRFIGRLLHIVKWYRLSSGQNRRVFSLPSSDSSVPFSLSFLSGGGSIRSGAVLRTCPMPIDLVIRQMNAHTPSSSPMKLILVRVSLFISFVRVLQSRLNPNEIAVNVNPGPAKEPALAPCPHFDSCG